MPIPPAGLPIGRRPSPARMATLAVAVVLTGTLAGCGKPAPKGPPPQLVEVASPIARRIVDWDDYVGRFEAVQDAEIRPRVSGQITRIFLQPGQHVRQGQPLFEIDPRPYAAVLAQAQAEVTRANALLINARQERERADQLFKAQAVSREEAQLKEANERTATATLAAARAAERTRRLDMDFTTVRSPITGLISDKRVSIGDYVTAGQTPLTRIVSLDPIRFTFDGAESLYLKYMREAEKGGRPSSRNSPNPIDIQLADDKTYTLHGKMDFVDNAIDNTSGTIRAHALVPNPGGRLVPGLFGRARLIGSGTYPALMVPDMAIVTDQTRRYVFVVDRDGKAAIRNVETGPMVDGLRVVRTGLTPRDRVVIDGLTRLQPGTALKIRTGTIVPHPDDQSPISQPAEAPQPAQGTAK